MYEDLIQNYRKVSSEEKSNITPDKSKNKKSEKPEKRGKNFENTLSVIWSLLTCTKSNVWNEKSFKKDGPIDMAIRHCKNVILSVSGQSCTKKANVLRTISNDQREQVKVVFLSLYPCRKDWSRKLKRRKKVAASDLFKSDIARICSQTKDIFELVIDFIHCCVKHIKHCSHGHIIQNQKEIEKQSVSGAMCSLLAPLNPSLQLPSNAHEAGQNQPCSSVSKVGFQEISSCSSSLNEMDFVADGGIPVKPFAATKRGLLNRSIVPIDVTDADSQADLGSHFTNCFIMVDDKRTPVQKIAYMLRQDLLTMRPFCFNLFLEKNRTVLFSLHQLQENGNISADAWTSFFKAVIKDVPCDTMTLRELRTAVRQIGCKELRQFQLEMEPYIERLSEVIVSMAYQIKKKFNGIVTGTILWNDDIAASFRDLLFYIFRCIDFSTNCLNSNRVFKLDVNVSVYCIS